MAKERIADRAINAAVDAYIQGGKQEFDHRMVDANLAIDDLDYTQNPIFEAKLNNRLIEIGCRSAPIPAASSRKRRGLATSPPKASPRAWPLHFAFTKDCRYRDRRTGYLVGNIHNRKSLEGCWSPQIEFHDMGNPILMSANARHASLQKSRTAPEDSSRSRLHPSMLP